MLSPWSCAEDGTLHLSNVQQNDAGEYYCTAENRGGQDQRQTILAIAGNANNPDIAWMGFISCLRKTYIFFAHWCSLFRRFVIVCEYVSVLNAVMSSALSGKQKFIYNKMFPCNLSWFLRLVVSFNTLLHSKLKSVQLTEPHSRQDWFCLQWVVSSKTFVLWWNSFQTCVQSLSICIVASVLQLWSSVKTKLRAV